MHLKLLGSIEYNEQAVEIPRKARAVLAYVAAWETPRRRSELIELFCAQAGDPRRTLRTLLSHIRRGLPGVLQTEGELVALGAGVFVDCRAFVRAVQEESVDTTAVALYGGEFMAGESLPDAPEYEMWLLGRRTFYQSLHEKALLALARASYRRGEIEAARFRAMQLVEANPYLEEGHALLVQTLMAEGHYAEASAHTARFSAISEKELGVPPSELFLSLVESNSAVAPAAPAALRGVVPPDGRRAPVLFNPEQIRRRLGRTTDKAQWRLLYDWALQTFESARRLWAYQDAAAALDTALFAAEQLRLPPEQLAELLARRVLLARYVDEPLTVQRRQLERAQALLEQAPTDHPVPVLELVRATLLHREGTHRAAVEVASAAAAALDAAGEVRLAGQARAVQGRALVRSGDNSLAASVLNQAQSLLSRAGDDEGMALAIGDRAWAALNRGRVEDAFSIAEEGLARLGRSPPPAAEARLHYTLAACWNYYYDPAGMEQAAQDAIAAYSRVGDQAMATRCEIYLVQVERYRFQREAAQRRLGLLFQKGRRYHDTWLLAWVMALFGQAAFRKGLLSEAEIWYSRAYGLRQQTGERQNQVYDLAWSGRLRAALGRLDSALSYTTAAVRQMERATGDYFPWEAWDMYLAHAEVLAQKGRGRQALATVDVAYAALQSFLDQIRAPRLRRQVLDFEHSRHLATAWRTRQIVPFHLRTHRLI